jgi:hypothetical protein
VQVNQDMRLKNLAFLIFSGVKNLKNKYETVACCLLPPLARRLFQQALINRVREASRREDAKYAKKRFLREKYKKIIPQICNAIIFMRSLWCAQEDIFAVADGCDRYFR